MPTVTARIRCSIGAGDVVLSSPIILYDRPEVARQSPGDLYDSTRDRRDPGPAGHDPHRRGEVRGPRHGPRAAAIIDRCDDMPPETWAGCTGRCALSEPEWPTIRPPMPRRKSPAPRATAPWWDPAADASVDPWRDTVWSGGVELAQGTVVRLHRRHRADAQDMFLDGLTAPRSPGSSRTSTAAVHLAVTVDDDPAARSSCGRAATSIFHPDEVEPLGPGAAA